MPAGLSHHLFAEDILSKQTEITKEYYRYFYFGAQFFDALYLYSFCGKKTNMGKVLHQRNNLQLFTTLSKLCNTPKLHSFALGVLSHYCFDTVLHPYVYYVENEYLKTRLAQKKADKVHYRMESDFDVFLYRKLKGNNDFDYRFYHDINLSMVEKKEFAALTAEIFLEAFGITLNSGRVKRSFTKYDFLAMILFDPSEIKQKLTSGVENLFNITRRTSFLFRRKNPDERYLNNSHNEWHNIFDDTIKSDASFFDMFAESEQKYFSLSSMLFNLPLAEDFNFNCNTGLKCK